MSKQTDEEKKYEAIGKTIVTFRYFLFAIKFISLFSIIACGVLYILHKPLWLAPIIGFATFIIYRSVRRFIFKTLYKFSKME